MTKTLKRFLCVALSLICCLSFSVSAFAAETTTVCSNATETSTFETTATPRATVGSLVFNLVNFGNSNQTQLVNQGSQTITFSDKPTSLSYVALPSSKSGTVWLRFSCNSYMVKLTADGKAHTVSLSNSGIPGNTPVTVTYTGANTPLVSISLVFGK